MVELESRRNMHAAAQTTAGTAQAAEVAARAVADESCATELTQRLGTEAQLATNQAAAGPSGGGADSRARPRDSLSFARLNRALRCKVRGHPISCRHFVGGSRQRDGTDTP